MRRAYPDKVFRPLVPRNVRIGEAPSHGMPVLRYDPACRGSTAYRHLAEELLGRSGEASLEARGSTSA